MYIFCKIPQNEHMNPPYRNLPSDITVKRWWYSTVEANGRKGRMVFPRLCGKDSNHPLVRYRWCIFSGLSPQNYWSEHRNPPYRNLPYDVKIRGWWYLKAVEATGKDKRSSWDRTNDSKKLYCNTTGNYVLIFIHFNAVLWPCFFFFFFFFFC